MSSTWLKVEIIHFFCKVKCSLCYLTSFVNDFLICLPYNIDLLVTSLVRTEHIVIKNFAFVITTKCTVILLSAVDVWTNPFVCFELKSNIFSLRKVQLSKNKWHRVIFMLWIGGLVACLSECPLLDFALEKYFFFSDRPTLGSNQPKKISYKYQPSSSRCV